MEATIKTLAAKEDIAIVKDDLAKFKYDLSKEITNSIKWMFVLWLGQIAATVIIFSLLF